jgi:hypothetical protein
MDNYAQTIRQPSYTALLVDSMDRYPNGYPTSSAELSSSSSWQLQSQQYLLNGYFNRIALTQIQFFWNLPTIITGYNDEIGIEVDDTATIYNIPQGYYSPTTLAAAIASATGLTAVSDPNNGIITLSDANPFTLLGPSSLAGHTLPVGRFLQTSGLVAGLAGGSGPYTLAPGIVPTMLPTRYIDITSRYLTKFQRVKDTNNMSPLWLYKNTLYNSQFNIVGKMKNNTIKLFVTE